jgi:hypothetical protein
MYWGADFSEFSEEGRRRRGGERGGGKGRSRDGGWEVEGDSAFVPGGESKNSRKIKEVEDVSEARRDVGNIMQGFDHPTSRPGSVQGPYSPRPGTFPVHALDSPSSRLGSHPVLLGQAQYSPRPGSVQLRMVPGLVRESSGLDLWKSSTGSSPFGGMEGGFGVDDIQAHILKKRGPLSSDFVWETY